MTAQASSAVADRPLVDAQGRAISYLRVALTDRCNFRCTYCSPAAYEAPEGLLSRAELGRLFRLFAGLGVRRIRLTGGEPTLRVDVVEIVADAAATPGIEDVALTTNGHRLAELVEPLRAAVRRGGSSKRTSCCASGSRTSSRSCATSTSSSTRSYRR